LTKALKKPTNVKKLKKKLYEKRGKLNRSVGKDWTQFACVSAYVKQCG